MNDPLDDPTSKPPKAPLPIASQPGSQPGKEGAGRRNLVLILLLLALALPVATLVMDGKFLTSQDMASQDTFLYQEEDSTNTEWDPFSNAEEDAISFFVVSGAAYVVSLLFIVPVILIAGTGAKKFPARKRTFNRLVMISIIAPMAIVILGFLSTCALTDEFNLPASGP